MKISLSLDEVDRAVHLRPSSCVNRAGYRATKIAIAIPASAATLPPGSTPYCETPPAICDDFTPREPAC